VRASKPLKPDFFLALGDTPQYLPSYLTSWRMRTEFAFLILTLSGKSRAADKLSHDWDIVLLQQGFAHIASARA